MTSEQAYLDLCRKVLAKGTEKSDRTNTGTKSIFGHQMRFNLQEGFPLLTTKKVPFRLIATELLWFINGDTNIRYLLQHNNNIWNEWAFKKWVESEEYKGPNMENFGNRAQTDPDFRKLYEEQMEIFKTNILQDETFAEQYGDLGNVYGRQWRHWRTTTRETIDQIANVIEGIKRHPESRRHIVSAWNPEDV